MTNFKDLYLKLLDNPQKRIVSVFGKEKRIKAMVRLTALNYLEGEYTKIIFNDGSFLLIIPEEEKFYYAEKIVEHIKEIPDSWIGVKEIIEYKGRKYKLENKNDYQFVLELILGQPTNIEGECNFSDYRPIDGPDGYLSLGWLCRTGKRADIDPDIIDLGEIEVK